MLSHPTSAELLPVHLLQRGQSASIGELVGRPEQIHRLEELGLRSGTVIEMLQPGSPCIIRVGEQRLCFRESEMIGVLVRAGAVD